MLNNIARNFRWHRTADKWGPRQLSVLEVGAEHSRLINMTRTGSEVKWIKALVLPRIEEEPAMMPAAVVDILHEHAPDTRYVSVVLSGNIGFVRLLNFPGEPGTKENLMTQVRQTLGVEEDHQVRFSVVPATPSEDGKSKSPEYAVLASSLPSGLVDRMRQSLIDANFVPVSLEPNGAIAANLADRHIASRPTAKSQGFLWISSRNSMLLLYSGSRLALARQFKVGIRTIIEALMEAFDLDYNTALKLFDSGSFDFSGNLGAAAAGWLHQVGISLDFIERRHNKRVEELQIYCGGARTQVLQDMFGNAVGRPVVEWDAIRSLGEIELPPDVDEPLAACFANPLCEAVRIMEKGRAFGHV